jgi:hypothetical protein
MPRPRDVNEVSSDRELPSNITHIASDGERKVLVNLQSEFVLADRIHEMIKADIGWIEKFTKHGLAKGTHFEAIIRDIIANQLPTPYEVSTGYIVDSATKECSNQVDVLVYDKSIARPLFECREFAIVDSETVRFTCEIKATLTGQDLTKWLDNTISSNLGCRFGLTPGFQEAHLFAFSSRLKMERIKQLIEEAFRKFFAQHPKVTESGGFDRFVSKMALPTVIIRDKPDFVGCDLQVDGPGGNYRVHLSHLKSLAKHGTATLLSALRHGTQTDRFSDPNFCDFTSTSARECLHTHAITPRFSAKYFVSNHALATMFQDGHDILLQIQKRDGKGVRGVNVPVLRRIDAYTSLVPLIHTPGVTIEYFELDPKGQ